jgi:uncharacterized protein YcnI
VDAAAPGSGASRRPTRRRIGSGLAAAAAALAGVPAALGHGSITPTFAPPATAQRFLVTVPNDRTDARVVGLSIAAPPGLELESADDPEPGWHAEVSNATITWRGGTIAALASETFAFRARLPDEQGTVEFQAREVYDDGPGPTFTLAVTVAGEAPAGGGLSRLAWAALGVSLAGLLLALVALGVWIRSRWPAAQNPERPY